MKTKPSFILGVVYRASYTDLLTERDEGTPLEAQLNECSRHSNRMIVVGDFNCNTEVEEPESKTKILQSVFDTIGMKQLIRKPTRIDMETRKSTTIDHVWTDPHANLIKEAGTIEGVSDHTGVYAIINSSKPKEEIETIKFRDYQNYKTTLNKVLITI